MRVIRILLLPIAIWVAGCFLWFLLGFGIMMGGAPSWLPLPWSDIEDFIEAPNGDIYVDLKFFLRIVRYDQTGKFIASYPYPSGGGSSKYTSLAVGHDGTIYIEKQQTVFTCNSELQVLSTLPPSYGYWELNENNQVVYGTKKDIPHRVNRAALPGDPILNILVNDKRESFQTHDGGMLIRKSTGLEKRFQGKIVKKYGPHWFLRIFTFPFPGFLAWLLAFLFGFLATRFQKRSQNQKTCKNSCKNL